MSDSKYTNTLHKKFLLWGSADIGEGLVTTISNTYLSVFMTDVACLPLGIISAAMLVMSVGDFALALMTGFVFALIPTMRWGKLRSYLIIAPPLAAFFFTVHFLSFYNRPVLSAVIITTGYLIARFFYNLSYSANLSLINVIAKDQSTRARLTSQKMMGANIGKLLGNYLTPVIIVALTLIVSERVLYPVIVGGASVVFVIMNLIHFALSRGYETKNSDTEVVQESKASIRQMITVLAHNHQLMLTVLIDLTSNVAALVLPSLAVYYYRCVAEDPSMVATHMLLIGIAALVGSLFVRVLSPKIRNPRKFLLIIYPLVGIILFSTRFAAENAYLFMGLNVVVHWITGMTQPLELSLYMDNVLYIKYTTGEDMNSMIMSISNVTVKLANILKSVLLPFALASAGYVAGTITPELKTAILNAYSTIPAIIPIIGFILLRFFYKLTKNYGQDAC